IRESPSALGGAPADRVRDQSLSRSLPGQARPRTPPRGLGPRPLGPVHASGGVIPLACGNGAVDRAPLREWDARASRNQPGATGTYRRRYRRPNGGGGTPAVCDGLRRPVEQRPPSRPPAPRALPAPDGIPGEDGHSGEHLIVRATVAVRERRYRVRIAFQI